MNYRDALNFLYGLQTFGIKLGLRNITNVLREIDNPQSCYPSIHVAGTNGKGSTAAIVESVLRAAGYKTGLFTSPHLFDFTERIRVRGRPIPRRNVSKGIEILKPLIEKYRGTFFETATALAFHYFREEQIDVAVVEVGMGGRLDATNVISSLCTIITDIDNDHTEYLGDKLESIAREKAAVIKENSTVITSTVHPEIRDVLESTCNTKGVTLYQTTDHCSINIREVSSDGSCVDIRTPFRSSSGLRFPLIGRHQLRNLTAAVMALDVLGKDGFATTVMNIREGVSRTVWPGRFQIIQRNPRFIVDGAHNPGGIRALNEALREFFIYDNLILIFGVMANKNYSEMAKCMAPLAKHVIVTRPNMNRALDCDVLAEEVEKYNPNIEIVNSVTRAVRRALGLAGQPDVVCAAGSLFLVGEILKSKFKRVEALFGLN